ncbi:dienelactone hydrolase family protein [Catellatospora sp. KI3]|uniref:alpha/beta hydrolase family protein n=1 Tax=Catellatospora sp. KI3 TaxID=3041620 RepID=UPI002482712C|nr:dienelactone hydrolase family protein [Catellatospora sp. KI3]MDI1464649.1 dienelactone hydrolase family protein [Catellatospora sp. KI3]
MPVRPLTRLALCLTLAALSGCTATDPQWHPDPVAAPAPSGTAAVAPLASTAPSPSASASASPPAPAGAPRAALAVGVRTLKFSRGGRSLPTTVWYPATGRAGGSPKANAPVAPGRFPLVVFSHGLHGLPAYYEQITRRLAAAGFVVAAPTFPSTNRDADPFNAGDMGNQPADVSEVITRVLKLDTTSGDGLRGHLDAAHVAVGGHSAGGFTSAGVLANKRDTRVRAAIVIAGGSMGAFKGARTPVLFVHGDKDPTVTYQTGRNAYTGTSWPKGFLTLLGQGHGEYLGPSAKGFDQVMKTMTDFLRWTMYSDAAARSRLSGDGTKSGVSKFEARW